MMNVHKLGIRLIQPELIVQEFKGRSCVKNGMHFQLKLYIVGSFICADADLPAGSKPVILGSVPFRMCPAIPGKNGSIRWISSNVFCTTGILCLSGDT